MKSVRLQPVKRQNATPQTGDLCYNSVGLFIWTEKHDEADVRKNLIEYKNTEVVDLALVEYNTNELFPVGTEVITSRWYKETVTSAYPKHSTFRTNVDDYLFDYDQAKAIVQLNVTKLYERVYNHDENDVFTGVSFKEHNLKDLMEMFGSNDFVYLDIESGKNGVILYNGCATINKHIAL